MTCLKIKANANKNIKIIRLVYEVITPVFEVENVAQDVDNDGGGGNDDVFVAAKKKKLTFSYTYDYDRDGDDSMKTRKKIMTFEIKQ